MTGAGDVCKCPELRLCWWGVQWRVWSEGWCSPRLGTQPASLHNCAWILITRVPIWGPLGGPLCRWPCYHCWITRGMCQKALDLERSNGKERTERPRSWSVVQAWTCCRVQASFHEPSVALEWAATASSAMPASTGCTKNAVGSSTRWPWLQMYMVPGNCMPLGRQTTEGSPS